MKTIQITPALSVSRQPTEEELRALPKYGFKTVIDLRSDGEGEPAMIPEEEREIAEDTALIYHHIPVSPKAMTEDDVDEFCEVLELADKPVLVHCKTGKRAGAFAMMHLAIEEGYSGEETVEKAEEADFEFDSPELKRFVINYVDRYVGAVS